MRVSVGAAWGTSAVPPQYLHTARVAPGSTLRGALHVGQSRATARGAAVVGRVYGRIARSPRFVRIAATGEAPTNVPEALRHLEDEVDRVAGVDAWIACDGGPCER